MLSTEASDSSSWQYGGSLRYTPTHVLKEEWEKRREAIKQASVSTTASSVCRGKNTFFAKDGAQELEKESRKAYEEVEKGEDGSVHGALLERSAKGPPSIPSLCPSSSLSVVRPVALYRLRLLLDVIRFGDRPRHPAWILLARMRRSVFSLPACGGVPHDSASSSLLLPSAHSPSVPQDGASSGSPSSFSLSDPSSFGASSSSPPSLVYEWLHGGISQMLSMLRTISIRVEEMKKKKTPCGMADDSVQAAMDVFGSFAFPRESSFASVSSYLTPPRKNLALLYCMLDALRLEMEDIWSIKRNPVPTGSPPPQASGTPMGAAIHSSSSSNTNVHAIEAVWQNVVDRSTAAINAFEWTVVGDVLLSLGFPPYFPCKSALHAHSANASSSSSLDVSRESPKRDTKGTERHSDPPKEADDQNATPFRVQDSVPLPTGNGVSPDHPVLHRDIPTDTPTREASEAGVPHPCRTAPCPLTPQHSPAKLYSMHYFRHVLEVLEVCRAVMAEAHWPSQLFREPPTGLSTCSTPSSSFFVSASSPFVAWELAGREEWWEEDTTKEAEELHSWLFSSVETDGKDGHPVLSEEKAPHACPDALRGDSSHTEQVKKEKESAMRHFAVLRPHTKAQVRDALRASDTFCTASSPSRSSWSSFSSSAFLVEGTRVIAMHALSTVLAADSKNLLGGATRPPLSVLATHWRECAASPTSSSSIFPPPFPSLSCPSSWNVSKGPTRKFLQKATPFVYLMALVWGGAYQREGLLRVIADVQQIFLHLLCVVETHQCASHPTSKDRRACNTDGLSSSPPPSPSPAARRCRAGCTCSPECFSFLPDPQVGIEEVEYLWKVWQQALHTSYQKYVDTISRTTIALFSSASCTPGSAAIASSSSSSLSFLWSAPLHPPSIFDLFAGVGGGSPCGKKDSMASSSAFSSPLPTCLSLTPLQQAALRVVTVLSELPHDLPPPYGVPGRSASDRPGEWGTTTKNAGDEGSEFRSDPSSQIRTFSSPFRLVSTAPHFTSVLLWIAQSSFTIHPSRLEAFTAVRMVLDRLVNRYIQENGPTHPYSTALAALRQKLVLVAKQEKLL